MSIPSLPSFYNRYINREYIGTLDYAVVYTWEYNIIPGKGGIYPEGKEAFAIAGHSAMHIVDKTNNRDVYISHHTTKMWLRAKSRWMPSLASDNRFFNYEPTVIYLLGNNDKTPGSDIPGPVTNQMPGLNIPKMYEFASAYPEGHPYWTTFGANCAIAVLRIIENGETGFLIDSANKNKGKWLPSQTEKYAKSLSDKILSFRSEILYRHGLYEWKFPRLFFNHS